MARNKGDKDYTKSEKQLLISLINDYSLFGATDSEIIRMLSTKIGKKISKLLFYRLEKEAVKKRGESEEWLDYYARFHFVEHYRKRIEEVELIQKNLLKVFADESEKPEDKKNKFLMNQLAKTIVDNSKVLAEFGMAPPILSKIQSMILSNIPNNNYGENLSYAERNKVDEEINAIKIEVRNAKSAIFPPIGNMNDSLDEYDNKGEISRDESDLQSILVCQGYINLNINYYLSKDPTN